MRVMVILGTRPEFIKTWSTLKALDNHSEIESIVVHTGQHYDFEMSQVFFEELSIREPDYFLEVGSHDLTEQTIKIMGRSKKVIEEVKPDLLLVQGDTNSTMATALTSVQCRVPVGHIEAGCRSYDLSMPEELNRIVIDSISAIHFAPSEVSYHNLLREGHNPNRVFLVGNTAKDALDEGIRLIGNSPLKNEQFAIVTIHRAGNVDNRSRLLEILQGLKSIQMRCIFPIHPRTKKRINEFEFMDIINGSNIELVNPMGYLSFLRLMQDSQLVITDSGGVQEEAALLGKPTLTVRNNTEWPETIWRGYNILVSADANEIKSRAKEVLSRDLREPDKLYQSGAGQRIVDIILSMHRKNALGFKQLDMIQTGYPQLALSTDQKNGAMFGFTKNGSFTTSEMKYIVLLKYRKLKMEE